MIRVLDAFSNPIRYNTTLCSLDRLPDEYNLENINMLDQLSNPWWVYVALGIFAGILSGMLGIGGGVILVPSLVLIMGFGQKSAQGMSLAIMVPMAFVGAIRYLRNDDVNMDMLVVGLIVCGSLAGTMIGTSLEAHIPAHVLRKIFSVVLVIVAVKMFVGSSRAQKAAADNNVIERNNVSVVETGGTDSDPGK